MFYIMYIVYNGISLYSVFVLTSFCDFAGGGFTDAAVRSGDDKRSAAHTHLQIRRAETPFCCLITAPDHTVN